jgi:branched-chain amino acid transport system permease protein
MKLFRLDNWLLYLSIVLVIIPLMFPSMKFINIVSEMLIMALFAVSLNLLIGYTGLVSFGHCAFFAIGSYTVGIMLQKFGPSLPFAIPLTLLCGMVLSGIGALIIGYFCTRLTEIYFAFLTLAFSQIIYSIIIKWEGFTGGDQGLVGGLPKPPISFFSLGIDMKSPYSIYFLVVIATVLSFFLLKTLTESPFGWIMRGIRDNSERIRFLGIDVRKYQIMIFVVSGIFTGLAGGLMALHVSGSYPDHAHWTKAAEPIFMIMVGGMEVFAGPILGAILVTQVSAYIVAYAGVGTWGLIFGGLLIVFLMFSRKGILDLLRIKLNKVKTDEVGNPQDNISSFKE